MSSYLSPRVDLFWVFVSPVPGAPTSSFFASSLFLVLMTKPMDVDPTTKTPTTMAIKVTRLMVEGATSEVFSGHRSPLNPQIGKSSGAWSTLSGLQTPALANCPNSDKKSHQIFSRPRLCRFCPRTSQARWLVIQVQDLKLYLSPNSSEDPVPCSFQETLCAESKPCWRPY